MCLSSPVQTCWLVARPLAVKCCQGANKSLVTNQQQDAIQEELVVNSTMAPSWLRVSRECEQARVTAAHPGSTTDLPHSITYCSLYYHTAHTGQKLCARRKYLKILNIRQQTHRSSYLSFEGDQFLWWGSQCRSAVTCFCIATASFPQSEREGDGKWWVGQPSVRHGQSVSAGALSRTGSPQQTTLSQGATELSNTGQLTFRRHFPPLLTQTVIAKENSWLNQKLRAALHLNPRGFNKLTAANLT